MKRRRKPLILRMKRWIPLLAGGSALQFINLSGCDEEVRNTFLTGVQESLTGLLTSVVNAFFLSLTGGTTTTTTTTTTKAITEITSWLA
ncbi:MAG: hypothetical protein MI923_19485 [Phycisphaerales bacterium]|nr:hypothetical protein [Phycisphaerales bacterium]